MVSLAHSSCAKCPTNEVTITAKQNSYAPQHGHTRTAKDASTTFATLTLIAALNASEIMITIATSMKLQIDHRLEKCSTEGRSIQSDGGVELKGVSWRSKASRSGIESEGWAERHDGKSP